MTQPIPINTQLPFVVNFPLETTRRSQAQLTFLANCVCVYFSLAISHIPLGAQENAGYHRGLTFTTQTTTPVAVQGYFQLFTSSNAINIQTNIAPSATPGIQPITPVKVPFGTKTNIAYPSSGTGAAFKVNISTAPILGTPLQTVIIDILPFTTFNVAFTSAIEIPYAQTSGTVVFTSIISAVTTTMTDAVNTSSPIWMMPQYNATFSGTPSLSNLGAYLSSCVVYINNYKMYSAKVGRYWTVTITGTVL